MACDTDVFNAIVDLLQTRAAEAKKAYEAAKKKSRR